MYRTGLGRNYTMFIRKQVDDAFATIRFGVEKYVGPQCMAQTHCSKQIVLQF